MISSRCASAHSAEISPARSRHASWRLVVVAAVAARLLPGLVGRQHGVDPLEVEAEVRLRAGFRQRLLLGTRRAGRCASARGRPLAIEIPVASSSGSDSIGATSAAGTARIAVPAAMRYVSLWTRLSFAIAASKSSWSSSTRRRPRGCRLAASGGRDARRVVFLTVHPRSRSPAQPSPTASAGRPRRAR